MNVLSLERRLRKVEAARSPERGLVFVLWVADDGERALSAAVDARAVAAGDLVARIPWPFVPAPPSAKWARAEVSSFDHVEFGCIALAASLLLERMGVDIDDEAAPRADYLRQVEDARLVATVFGQRIGSPAAEWSGFTRAKVIDAAREIDVRARIRGCYGALIELGAVAA